MRFSRSVILPTTALLAIAALPAHAVSQEPASDAAPEVAVGPASPGEDVQRVAPLVVRHVGPGCTSVYRFHDRGVLEIDPRYQRDFDDTFAQYSASSCYFLGRSELRTLYGWDGDYGGGGGRPDPSSPTSQNYPDTSFDLATALAQLEAKRNPQPVPISAPSSVPGKLRRPIPPVREPPGDGYAARTTKLAVRTAPVVTRQMMEQRILRGQIRRGEVTVNDLSDDVSAGSGRPDTPRSAAQRAARTRPASARRAGPARSSGSVRSAAPARSASPSSSASSGKSRPKSSRGSAARPNPE